MAIPITVPRLGWNMEQGVFVGWLKADGAEVRAGEALFTLESEKATEDIEGFDDGILHIPADGPRKGDIVPVGAAIGFLLHPGETPPAPASRPSASAAPPTNTATTAVAVPVASAVVSPPSRASSPRARRVAAEMGIDLERVRGSGRTGRIRERDVRAVAQSDAPSATAEMSSIRRLIAERMLSSHLTTAPVTLTATTDATQLVQLRNQFKAMPNAGEIPSYTDLLVKLTAIALARHPSLNSRWENDRIVSPAAIHIGIAVDTEAGLLVPVIRDVASLDLKELAARSRDLIDRARRRKLSAEELQGGTFTVTSLGSLGVDAFTPIINSPECAILGIGRIQKRPAVVDERIVARDQLTLSLTFDHRIVDGAPAARFLQTLTTAIENPGAALLS